MRALVTGCGRRLGILFMRTAGGRWLAGDERYRSESEPSWPTCGHWALELVQADLPWKGGRTACHGTGCPR